MTTVAVPEARQRIAQATRLVLAAADRAVGESSRNKPKQGEEQ